MITSNTFEKCNHEDNIIPINATITRQDQWIDIAPEFTYTQVKYNIEYNPVITTSVYVTPRL
jgi:hypothetical protein